MQDIMNSSDIAFPNLGLYLENVPKGFFVGKRLMPFARRQ